MGVLNMVGVGGGGGLVSINNVKYLIAMLQTVDPANYTGVNPTVDILTSVTKWKLNNY